MAASPRGLTLVETIIAFVMFMMLLALVIPTLAESSRKGEMKMVLQSVVVNPDGEPVSPEGTPEYISVRVVKYPDTKAWGVTVHHKFAQAVCTMTVELNKPRDIVCK